MTVFFQMFLQTVHALRLKESKCFFVNAFIFIPFTVENKKISKNDNRKLFGASLGNLHMCFNP